MSCLSQAKSSPAPWTPRWCVGTPYRPNSTEEANVRSVLHRPDSAARPETTTAGVSSETTNAARRAMASLSLVPRAAARKFRGITRDWSRFEETIHLKGSACYLLLRLRPTSHSHRREHSTLQIRRSRVPRFASSSPRCRSSSALGLYVCSLSAQRAAATKLQPAEVRLVTCAQLSEAGS